jgi:hypothetical protein
VLGERMRRLCEHFGTRCFNCTLSISAARWLAEI